MYDLLFENNSVVYLLLATTAIILIGLWCNHRKRKLLIAAGVVVLLTGIYYGLSFFAESDARQIERKINEMAAGVPDHLDRTFGHISDRFKAGDVTKSDLRKRAQEAIRRFGVREVVVWDINVKEVSRDTKQAKVSFNAKAKGNWGGEEAFYRIEAEFMLEPENEWRMTMFVPFNPFVNSDEPATIPGFWTPPSGPSRSAQKVGGK